MKSLNEEEIMVPNLPNSPVFFQITLFESVYV